MSNRTWLVIVVVLAFIIVVLTWVLFTTPAEAPVVLNPATATSSQSKAESAPLHNRVIVTVPKSGASVTKDFDVVGEAPGQWYFEASFPIQVRDRDGNVVGRTHANALGEWMTEAQVKFNATVHVDSYSGPATLILLKDNPSGLPENDDSIEIPIIVR